MTLYQIVSLVIFLWFWFSNGAPMLVAIIHADAGAKYKWSVGIQMVLVASLVNLLVSFLGYKGFHD